MHYKNGREAKNGDKIAVIPDPKYGGTPRIGILYDAQAGNDYCNGRLAAMSSSDPMPNLKECLHLDDVSITEKLPDDVRAKRVYEAYCLAVGGKAFNGDHLPDWETFKNDPAKSVQSNAWIVAAKAI